MKPGGTARKYIATQAVISWHENSLFRREKTDENAGVESARLVGVKQKMRYVVCVMLRFEANERM